MDQGKIIESDSPWNLLNDNHSIFKELVLANGQKFYEKMINILKVNRKNN